MGLKLNWSDLFTIKLNEHGFSQSDIAKILRLEMDAYAYFYFDGLIPSDLYLQNIECTETEIIYHWKSYSNKAECPDCNTVSTHAVGNYYPRRIQDVPQLGKTVYHVVDSKNYYCENKPCETGKFVERFYEFVDEYARKTKRFKNYCIERSLGCGCNEAEREIRMEGGIVSNDSIGRYIKGQAAKYIESNLSQATVRVLAVDDINLRKGDSGSGCTVFIDQETHKILIIVRGTTKEAAAKVMELFPTAEFLSRDRATAYSSAGAELDFTQVADRFHLITNAQTAVKEALMASIPANILIREGDGWVQIGKEPGTSDNNTSYFSVPEQAIEERIGLAGLTAKQGQKYRETMKMLELADKGMKTADIAKELGISYKNVQTLRRNAVDTLTGVEDKINKRIEKQKGINEQSAVEEKTMQTPGERAEKTVAGKRVEHSSKSIVEPYRETVIKMWQAGGNHRTIYPVLQAEGYTGSKNAIYQYILKLGKESPDEMSRERKQGVEKENPEEDNFDILRAESRPDLSLESVSRNNVYKAILKEASKQREQASEVPPTGEALDEKAPEKAGKKKRGTRPASSNTSPFSEDLLNLIYGPEPESDKIRENSESNSGKKKLDLEKLVALFPIIRTLIAFLVDCYAVFDSCNVEALDALIAKYSNSDIDALSQYVNGLHKDYDAVKNCLIYRDISNGPIEGCNNRIKMIHRRSGGRADLELLNAFAVLWSNRDVKPKKPLEDAA